MIHEFLGFWSVLFFLETIHHPSSTETRDVLGLLKDAEGMFVPRDVFIQVVGIGLLLGH